MADVMMEFKVIPGNKDYLINLDGTVVDNYNRTVSLEIDRNNNVRINLFGKFRKVNLKTLSLLAYYEMGYITDLEKHLNKILFCQVPVNSLKIKCGYIPTFTEPIEFKEGFNHIPAYAKYAINIKGDVLDTFSNKIVTDTMIDTSGYPAIYIRNPIKSANRYTRIHRLLAMAFLPNTDFISRSYVNHINGNREDYSLTNLEWCSLVENSQHAIKTGLVKTLVKMKTRDRFTGEITFYNSAVDLARSLGTKNVTASNWKYRLPGYLYNGRYEIKTADDPTPWYYENNNIVPAKAIFTITVVNKRTGEISTFNKIGIFNKAYQLTRKSLSFLEIIEIFKEKYKDCDVSYVKNTTTGPYRLIDINTSEEIILSSIARLAEYTGINRNELQFDLCRKRKFIYFKRWVISNLPLEEEVDLTSYQEKYNKAESVIVLNVESGIEKVYDSIKGTSRAIGITPRTIVKYLESGGILKGYKFRSLR